MRFKALKLALPLSVLLATTFDVNAADFSFTGNFTNDNDVPTFNFSIGVPSTVILRTWSYAGGTNATWNTIERGGFDPVLTLFDRSTGALLSENDDGNGSVATDINGSDFDAFLTASLASGNYTVSIQQNDNFALGPNLSDGFSQEGIANMNFNDGFVDRFNDEQRDAHWALDILNVNSAVLIASPVPEPETYSMMLAGLAFIGFALRRRKTS